MKAKEKENVRVENLYQCTSFVYSCCECVDYLWCILSFYPRNKPEDQNLSQTFFYLGEDSTKHGQQKGGMRKKREGSY